MMNAINEEDEKKTYFKKNYLVQPLMRQLLVCSPLWISYFIIGLIVGAPPIEDPVVKEINISSSDDFQNKRIYSGPSWLNSSLGAECLPWIIFLPMLMFYVGRKLTFLIIWLGIFICYVISYYSSISNQVLANNIIVSIAVTCGQTVAPTLIAEYSSSKYRGFFLTFKSSNFALGMWISKAFGATIYWKNITFFSFLFIVYFSVIILWPESPYWSACKGRYTECILSHRWLKGTDEDSEKELDNLIRSYRDYHKAAKRKRLPLISILQNIIKALKSPEVYKPALVTMILVIHFEFSGELAINVYTLIVLQKITKSETGAFKTLFIFDVFLILVSYVTCILTLFVRRRSLYLNLSAISFLFLFVLSFYLHMISLNLLIPDNYVTLAIILIHMIALTSGPISMSSTLCAELLPITYRSSFLVALGLLINFMFAISKVIDSWFFVIFALNYALPFYGVISLICTIFLYILLPETKDRTLQDIETHFKSNDYTIECRRHLDLCFTV